MGDPVPRDVVLRNANSQEFNRLFRLKMAHWARLRGAPSRDLASLYSGESFFSLCEESRRQKKPILVLMIRDRNSIEHHALAAEALLEPDLIR